MVYEASQSEENGITGKLHPLLAKEKELSYGTRFDLNRSHNLRKRIRNWVTGTAIAFTLFYGAGTTVKNCGVDELRNTPLSFESEVQTLTSKLQEYKFKELELKDFATNQDYSQEVVEELNQISYLQDKLLDSINSITSSPKSQLARAEKAEIIDYQGKQMLIGTGIFLLGAIASAGYMANGNSDTLGDIVRLKEAIQKVKWNVA